VQQRNKKLTKGQIVKPWDNSNQLTITCSKPLGSLVTGTVISSAGNLPAINVPESPPVGPTIEDRLSALEGKFLADQAATDALFKGVAQQFGLINATVSADIYQCPNNTNHSSGSLGGGAFYGCQGQLTTQPNCVVWEFPRNETVACTKVGKLRIAPP